MGKYFTNSLSLDSFNLHIRINLWYLYNIGLGTDLCNHWFGSYGMIIDIYRTKIVGISHKTL